MATRSTRTLFASLAAAVTIAIVMVACRDNTAIPRPSAYPRLTLYDTTYVDAAVAPPHFEVNASAIAKKITSTTSDNNNNVWLDVIYPAYKATLHCTFTPVDSISRIRVTDNRAERMALNIGDNEAEQTEITNPNGYVSIVLTASGPTLTPVQFLSAGSDWVISGALELNDVPSAAALDSIRPMIDAVKTDVIHTMRNLK